MYMNKGSDYQPKQSEKPKINMALYEKMKKQKPEKNSFAGDFSLESIVSKLAVISFFLFIVSLTSLDMKTLTVASFAGFLMFSFFYGFLRITNPE